MKILIRTAAILILLAGTISHAHEPIPGPEHDYLITIETGYGKMIILLFDETPLHKENFVTLAKAGVYNGNLFHRVIEHFMIQTGDPSTSGNQAAIDRSVIPEHVPAEFSPDLLHKRGAVGAARYGNDRNPMKNSSPTQFYIVQHERAGEHLDGEYTVFGQVMSGLEVIDKIAAGPTDERDRPLNEVRIKQVTVDLVTRPDVEKFYNFTY